MFHCHLPHHMMNQMVSMVGPMTHTSSGMHSGMGMEEGMGIIREGHAMSEELGPSLGRAIGMSTFEKATSHLVGVQENQQHQHDAQMASMDAQQVPGYPQDMWMPMDEMFIKPETHGLRSGWTAAMIGMMSLVRVLPPDRYEEVMALVREGRKKPEKQPSHQPARNESSNGPLSWPL